MKTTRPGFAVIVILMSITALAGCSYEITGTVTNLQSGQPLADASVGMFESPVPDGGQFVEKARTDSEGNFQFECSWFSRTFEAHAQDHQVLTSYLGAPSNQTLDVKMRSITDIRGTWNATMTLEGGETRLFQFVFSEEGMSWQGDGEDFGTVPLSARAPEIVLNDSLTFSRVYTIGHVEGELEVGDAGDTMTGTITNLRLYDDLCSPCNGTVEAVRAGS